MARVTVEDCTQVIPNRFELVAIAAQRAHIVAAGSEITVDRDNDKDAVIALREIAYGSVNIDSLRESLVRSKQLQVVVDEHGVEAVEEVVSDDGISSDEIREEISALQANVTNSEAEDDIYGGDDVSVSD
jgi:DNA-directed RNA polymerase subunit omega